MTRRFLVHTSDGNRECTLCGERIPAETRFIGVYQGPPSPPMFVARVCELCVQTVYSVAMHEDTVHEPFP